MRISDWISDVCSSDLLPRDGRTRPARPDHRGLWLRRRLLCRLWPDRPRGRGRRFRLPLDDERAVEPGDASDLCLWLGSPAREIPAQAGDRRKIGRAHVCTPVTNAHLVCRLLLEKKKKPITSKHTNKK